MPRLSNSNKPTAMVPTATLIYEVPAWTIVTAKCIVSATEGLMIRKFFLAAASIIPLVFAVPASSQGVQLPSASNATPPAGTLSNGRTSTSMRRGPVRNRRPVRSRAHSETQPGPSSQQLLTG